ncbi:ankyrin repeat domain-containing protein [Candidatus Babeliales bacterium]|nr:ankyrin repeat domain-containing protein [Candidatus Babeliales bacterium]
MLKTDLYSEPAKYNAKEFLLFLHKSCGDNIIINQEKVSIDPLVSLRISTEVVADLAKLPMKTVFSIQSLPAIENQQKKIEVGPEKDINEPEVTDIAIAKLFYVIEEQNIEEVASMIEEQPGLVNKKNMIDKTSESYGRLPLHHALFKPKLALVNFLIENGSRIDAQDRNGRTALFIAYQFFKEEAVKRIIQEKPSINILDNRGISVLHLALDYVDPVMLALFLEHGGNLSAQTEQTLKRVRTLIQESRIQPSDKALPRDKKMYVSRIKILTNEKIKSFIDEHTKKFSEKEKDFLDNLYQ